MSAISIETLFEQPMTSTSTLRNVDICFTRRSDADIPSRCKKRSISTVQDMAADINTTYAALGDETKLMDVLQEKYQRCIVAHRKRNPLYPNLSSNGAGSFVCEGRTRVPNYWAAHDLKSGALLCFTIGVDGDPYIRPTVAGITTEEDEFLPMNTLVYIVGYTFEDHPALIQDTEAELLSSNALDSVGRREDILKKAEGIDIMVDSSKPFVIRT